MGLSLNRESRIAGINGYTPAAKGSAAIWASRITAGRSGRCGKLNRRVCRSPKHPVRKLGCSLLRKGVGVSVTNSVQAVRSP